MAEEIFSFPPPPVSPQKILSEENSPEREMFFCNETNCITKSGTVLVTEEIDVETYTKFVISFKYLESKGHPITIFINSPGGDILYMFSMYDLVRNSKVQVTTVGTGEIASACVLLLVCGTKRLVTENATLMSHQGEFSAQGSADAVKEHAKFTQWCENRWAELMARHTPKTPAYWKKISKKKAELWVLGGDAIVKAGFADEVLK